MIAYRRLHESQSGALFSIEEVGERDKMWKVQFTVVAVFSPLDRCN